MNAIRQLSLRPFLTSHLGYERLFNELEYMMAQNYEAPTYPPFNVFKDTDGYTIELALAGFKKEEITIHHDRRKSELTIAGTRGDSASPEREVLKKGIGTRSFTRSFTIAEDLVVQSAAMQDGILTITLKTVVREQDRPLLIDIE